MEEKPQAEWGKIKDVICGIAASLEMVCNMMPEGALKKLVCSIANMVKMVCNLIPDNANA